MRKIGLAVALTGLLLGYGSSIVLARGGGGGNHAGGMAPGHMSSEGQENSNAQWSPDATKGQDRAAEQRNAEGAEHGKAKAGTQQGGKTKGTRPTHVKD